MSEKKISDLIDLNYRMLSFIETILSNEENCLKHGKHIYMKELFMIEFDDIVNKKNDICEEISIDMSKSDTEKQTISDDEIITNKMRGGHDNSDNKKVVFDATNDKIYEIEKIFRKKDTTKAKIDRRLKRMYANDVKKIGKEFNIKPTNGKKYLTKNDVVERIKRNTRIYSKIIDHIDDNYNDIVTES
jgi:hypothetical protein